MHVLGAGLMPHSVARDIRAIVATVRAGKRVVHSSAGVMC